jgi:hypothetical protein
MGDAAARLTGLDAHGARTPQPGVDNGVRAVLDRFFAHYYTWHPVQATFTGIHDFDARLPDWSPAGLEACAAERRSLRRALTDAGRVEDDRVSRYPDEADLALADGFLEIQAAEHASDHFVTRNPALWTGEALFGVIALVTRDFAPLEERLEAAARRMRMIPGFLDTARHLLGKVPTAWRDRAVRECAAGARLFGVDLPRWWDALRSGGGIDPLLFDALVTAAVAASGGFSQFARWLTRDGRVDTREQAGAGTTLLALLLRRGHWCATPIDVLLAEARDELRAAAADLHRRADALAQGGWPQVQEQLAAAHPAADDYLPAFERAWRECRDLAIARELVTWPDAPVRYVPIPDHTRAVAPDLYYLFYRSPAPFDRLPLHEYTLMPIDLPGIAGEGRSPSEAAAEQRRRLQAANHAAITLNHVVHHGALGHHVQNYYAARAASRIGQVAGVDGASRIGMFSAGTLVEGWACYACDLAEEAGLLTPLQQVAQQHTRVRLLTRAVADLELHSGQRTLADTALLYRQHAQMTEAAARAEAVKNSMFPGAAVMYWLGTRDLHALRRTCEAREGGAFRLRAFHDRLLSYGAIPVPLVARLMTGGIA